jgi:hypothetical protein
MDDQESKNREIIAANPTLYQKSNSAPWLMDFINAAGPLWNSSLL